MSSEIKNRRPIRTRQTPWAKNTATWLQQKGIMPNDISLLSIISAEIAGIALLLAFFYDNYVLSILCFIVAILGIQGRLICNLLDGMVAVEVGLKSATGVVYNELPDRVADIVIFLGLGYGLWMFTSAAYLGWAGALFAVMTAYVRLLGGTSGLEQQFLGPLAKQHRMAVVTAGCGFAIILPFYAQWILYCCLWVIVLGSLVTIIWRTYHIICALRLSESLGLPINITAQSNDNQLEIYLAQESDSREPTIFIDDSNVKNKDYRFVAQQHAVASGSAKEPHHDDTNASENTPRIILEKR